MDASIWAGTLDSFRERVAGTDAAVAGVAAAAVSASLGLSLLIKVLQITGRRKSFSGDREQLGAWVEAARKLSANLARAADDDIARATSPAKAIEAPLGAARSAAAGLNLCAEAAAVVRGSVAADLGVAAFLLASAVRAILLCVEFNLWRRLSSLQSRDSSRLSS